MPRRVEAAPPAPRVALVTALLLAAAGLVLSVLLVRVHQQAHAGGTPSFCTLSDTVNCDRVAASRWSMFLGLPVAAWGVLGYAIAAALAVAGLRSRRPHAGWPAGLLLALGGLYTLVAIGLGLVSKLVIGAWCLLCMGSWAASLGLLACGFWASRPVGARAALRADLAAVRATPGRAGALGLALVGLVALAAAAWPHPPARPPAPPPAASQAIDTGAPVAALEPGVVHEYSDYECPYCALAHEANKAALARRPDVRLVRRQFPLDPACNPVVKRAVHPGACLLARAAVCGEEQGRFEEMDDALFANQKEKLPVEEVATRAGLDLARFRACLASPASAARVAADVSAGIAAGVPATPAYVVGRTVKTGQLPWELLPPPPAAPKP